MSGTSTPIMRIDRHRVGDGAPCFVIAEIGINHGGSRERAIALIDAAVAAGADAVKFQKRALTSTYRSDIVANPGRAEQGVQYLVAELKEAELSDEDFRAVRAYAATRGVTFLCTPWDEPSVAFLETIDVAAYKIGSPDMTNVPLIEAVVSTGRPLIISTGMSSEDEIRRALALLDAHHAEYAVLHCVSTYPSAPDEVNLRFMELLRDWSGRPVGYSGHETGLAVSTAAVALGACILERHLTLDRTERGPDHKASLEPAEFRDLVRAVRETEAALGAARRWMTRGEMLNRRSLAKSLVAAREIPAGTALTREMIASKSPGLGVSPQHIDALIGRTTTRSLAPDDPFVPADLRDAAKRSRAPSRVDVGVPWGVVVRYGDFPALTARFGPLGMGFVEFHLSDKDADARITKLPGAPFPFGLVVHAPEYRGDLLPDLCAEDESERAAAVASAQRAVDAARELGTQFSFESSVFPRGPKVVVHAGGMSKPGAPYETATAISRLRAAARRIDASGVELLIENLPPQPWYFGGRWDGHVMCDVESVVQACTQTGLGLCFDTSHAALACAASGASLSEFADRVKPFVRHLHVADGAGMSGEGLQIGDGVVNFVDILPRLTLPGVTLVPEIWMGHHETGEGFEVALHRLTELHWAREVIGRTPDPETRATLAMLTVSDTATTFGTLRVIDANRMGIAFVIDAAGKVVGVATDGDIRHAFVRGLGLHSPIVDVMNRDFVFGTPELTRAQIRSRLPGRTRVMPILDHEGRLVDVANLWTVGDATP